MSAAAPQASYQPPLDLLTHQPGALRPDEAALLGRVIRNLNLLADLSHADLLLYVRDGDNATLVAQAQPQPVPSLHPSGLVGQKITRASAPAVFRVLSQGSRHQIVRGTLVRGVPAMQEVFPIFNSAGQAFAALSSDIALLEHERQRRKSAVFRRAVARVRELVLGGRLQGGEMLGRMGVHDGPLVIDANGQIVYISAIAEYLYRRLGYADSLLKTQISELDTNEYICFKAMELGACLEQRVQEQELIWIKRVIPLGPAEPSGPLGWLMERPLHAGGAVVVIQDVTGEVQKEQELRIKSAMIREIHHRVKNNLQTIAALLRLQARRTGAAGAQELLRESVNRILSVAVVHEFLSRDEASVIDMHEVANRILRGVQAGVLDPEKRLQFRLEGARGFHLPAQQATSCALIMNELLQNSVEHGFVGRREGTIRLGLFDDGDGMRIEVEDDGSGLPPNFQDGGLGLQIVRTLVQEDLKGHLQVENAGGVRVVLSFPRWNLSDGQQ